MRLLAPKMRLQRPEAKSSISGDHGGGNGDGTPSSSISYGQQDEGTVVYRQPNFISHGISTIASELRVRQTWIEVLLFGIASGVLLGISSIAYWSFYYYYIPQISLQHDIHLQFGEGHPYGFVNIGSELSSFQDYQISMDLQLPRTPSNLDAGNFMVDLSIYSQEGQQALQEASSALWRAEANSVSAESSVDLTPYRLAHSRRTGILTYASGLVETASRVAQMPFFIFGLRREAEKLTIPLVESVQFSRGENHMPGVLKVDIRSERRMHVYAASVRMDARFGGLRYFMYYWKIPSFVAFSSVFWITTMLFTGATWLYLASGSNQLGVAHASTDGVIVKKEDVGDRGADLHARGEEGMAPSRQGVYTKSEPLEMEGKEAGELAGMPAHLKEVRGELVPSMKEEGRGEEERGSMRTGVKQDGEIIEEEEHSSSGGVGNGDASEPESDVWKNIQKENTSGAEDENEEVEEKSKSEAQIRREQQLLESTLIASLLPAAASRFGTTTRSQHQGNVSPQESSMPQRRRSTPHCPESDEGYIHFGP